MAIDIEMGAQVDPLIERLARTAVARCSFVDRH